MAGKWVELLKEIEPRVTRMALLVNPETAPGGGSYFMGPIDAAAASWAWRACVPVRNKPELEPSWPHRHASRILALSCRRISS